MLGFFKRKKNKKAEQDAAQAAAQSGALDGGRDSEQGDTRDNERDNTRDNVPTVQIVREEMDCLLVTAMATHIGTREYQQDALYVSEGGQEAFGILCDGMGGMEDGEKASADVVEHMANSIAALDAQADIPARLEEAVHEANERVLREDKGSGTTLVAVIAKSGLLYWASVGDSRIYIIRGEEMVQVTRDHNYALQLQGRVESGEISQQQAEEDPQKDALISYIGSPAQLLVDVSRSPFELQAGDTVLLCSDGLTKSLSDERIMELIRTHQPLEEAARVLPLTAFDEASGGQDNTSVILMQYVQRC